MDAEFSRPKRRVSTLVSSGCGSLYSIGLLNLPQAIEQPVEFLGSYKVVKIVIHLDSRRPRARPDAFHFFERNPTIGRDFLMTYADFPASMLPKLHAPAQQATDVGADLHMVLTERLLVQHGVVTDHLIHLQRTHSGAPCHLFDQFRSHRANLILR